MPPIVKWPGLGGRQYRSELYPIGTGFKPVSGVYIFCKSSGYGQWDPIYVGESSDLNDRLNTRLQSHHAWPRCKAMGATHVCVTAITYPRPIQARLDLETELRHSLTPPVNRQPTQFGQAARAW